MAKNIMHIDIKGLSLIVNKDALDKDFSLYNVLSETTLHKPIEIEPKSFFYFFFDNKYEQLSNSTDNILCYNSLKKKLQEYQITPTAAKTALDKIDQAALEDRFTTSKTDYDSHMDEVDKYYNDLDTFTSLENNLCKEKFNSMIDGYFKVFDALKNTKIPFEEYPQSIINMFCLVDIESKPAYIHKDNIVSYLIQKVHFTLDENSAYVNTRDVLSDYVSIKSSDKLSIHVNKSENNDTFTKIAYKEIEIQKETFCIISLKDLHDHIIRIQFDDLS